MKDKFRGQYERMGLMISLYRRKKKLTQKELGERVDIDAQHMSRIERAAVGISLDLLFDLARALEVKPHKLLDFSPLEDDSEP